MPLNCAICKKPVIVGPVVDKECLESVLIQLEAYKQKEIKRRLIMPKNTPVRGIIKDANKEDTVHMGTFEFEQLRAHVGHNVVVASYGNGVNVSVECVECNEVLYSVDNPTICKAIHKERGVSQMKRQPINKRTKSKKQSGAIWMTSGIAMSSSGPWEPMWIRTKLRSDWLKCIPYIRWQQCITYPNLQKYAIISHMANHTGGIYAKSITVRL